MYQHCTSSYCVNQLTITAVKVSNTEDISGAALRGVMEATAGDVCLTINVAISRHSEGRAGKEQRGDGKQLHYEVLVVTK
jgi:hypothetical protein